MSVLENFEQWKSFLGERVEKAKQAGMNQESIKDIAYQIGSYLANNVNPENKQEKLLQELWNVGSEQERHTMAGLMVKLVDQEQQRQQQH